MAYFSASETYLSITFELQWHHELEVAAICSSTVKMEAEKTPTKMYDSHSSPLHGLAVIQHCLLTKSSPAQLTVLDLSVGAFIGPVQWGASWLFEQKVILLPLHSVWSGHVATVSKIFVSFGPNHILLCSDPHLFFHLVLLPAFSHRPRLWFFLFIERSRERKSHFFVSQLSHLQIKLQI